MAQDDVFAVVKKNIRAVLVHLDGDVDLLRCQRNLPYLPVGLFCCFQNARQRFSGLVRLTDTHLHFFRAFLHSGHDIRHCVLHIINDSCDLSSSLSRFFGQPTYLIGHHCEALAVLTGPCSLDSRVESQQVRL